jgi:hypothetical protein
MNRIFCLNNPAAAVVGGVGRCSSTVVRWRPGLKLAAVGCRSTVVGLLDEPLPLRRATETNRSYLLVTVHRLPC